MLGNTIVCLYVRIVLRASSIPKYRVAAEDKSNIVYEIGCNNCKAVYLGESKRSLKLRSDKQKRSVSNCNCEKNEIAKHCWEANHNFSWY